MATGNHKRKTSCGQLPCAPAAGQAWRQRPWFCRPRAERQDRADPGRPACGRHQTRRPWRMRISWPASNVGAAGPGRLVVDLLGIVAKGRPQALRHAEHVGIHRQGRDAERIAQHHVGRLPAHPGELRRARRACAAPRPAVALHQRPGHAEERLGLGPDRSRWSGSRARADRGAAPPPSPRAGRIASGEEPGGDLR